MAVNPMQKKATTAALIAVLVTLLITGAVIALLMMKVGNLNKQIAEKRANLGKVFVLNSDVKSGQEITSEMLKLQEVEMSTVPTSAVICLIPHILTRPVILIGCPVDHRIKCRVYLSPLYDIQSLLVLFKTHRIPVCPGCRNQEEQRLCPGITGTLGHDIERAPS